MATVGVAAAAGVGEQSCRGEANRYTICILISRYGLNDFQVYVGIDVVMSQQYAQEVIDLAGDPFSATVYGEDPVWDDTLMGLRMTVVRSAPPRSAPTSDPRQPERPIIYKIACTERQPYRRGTIDESWWPH